MTWNKSGFSSKGKDRMRARNQPNFKKSLQWRHSVTMVRRSSRNRCNDLLPSIFPALGFHLFTRVCTPFVTTCVSGNRRSLVGYIRPHCFYHTYRLTYKVFPEYVIMTLASATRQNARVTRRTASMYSMFPCLARGLRVERRTATAEAN
jgi:hypothetical protein